MQRGSGNRSAGYSSNAHCIGKRLHLESNSGCTLKSIGGGVAIGAFRRHWHVETAVRVYLERIRNRMQKPIEGLLSLHAACFI